MLSTIDLLKSAQYLQSDDREMSGAQSEAYVEYNRRGEVIKVRIALIVA